jgi:NitT/TauT family transport system ATP-binding protein
MKLENVKKSYENKVVFEGLTVELPERETSCLMGASGCGKTTVMRLLLGLEMPDEGRVEGGVLAAAVFQENRLCDGLDAVSNVLLADEKGKREDALALLSALGLDGHTEKPVCELSGGMRRRVAIARALFAPATHLFLDEPFTGLDEDTKEEVIRFVKEKCAEKTVLLITHEPEEAKAFASRLFLMENGTIKEIG